MLKNCLRAAALIALVAAVTAPVAVAAPATGPVSASMPPALSAQAPAADARVVEGGLTLEDRRRDTPRAVPGAGPAQAVQLWPW